MLPFTSSDLLWWEWLLCAAGLLLVARVAYLNSIMGQVQGRGRAKSTFLRFVLGTVFLVSLLASLLCFVMGSICLFNASRVAWPWS
jgi:hypothetical protein